MVLLVMLLPNRASLNQSVDDLYVLINIQSTSALTWEPFPFFIIVILVHLVHNGHYWQCQLAIFDFCVSK